jgi:hypothetical protein
VPKPPGLPIIERYPNRLQRRAKGDLNGALQDFNEASRLKIAGKKIANITFTPLRK